MAINYKTAGAAALGLAMLLVMGLDASAQRNDQDVDNPNIEPVRTLPPLSPVRQIGLPVGRLLIRDIADGVRACTAFVISERFVMTNAHCVPGDFIGGSQVGEFFDSPRAEAVILEMGFFSGDESTVDRYSVDIVPVEVSRILDFAILRVDDQPIAKWGKVTLALDDIGVDQAGVVIHHPEGLPQQVTQNDCRLVEPSPIYKDSSFVIDYRNASGELTRALRFETSCAIRQGSSGSPFFLIPDGTVVGLMSSGSTDVNLSRAIPMSLIATSSQVVRDLILGERGLATGLILRGHEAGVIRSEYSHDGQHIVTSDRDGTVRVWDLKSGDELHTLQGHKTPVTSARFNVAGTRIVTAARDDPVAHVWNTATGALLVSLEGHRLGVADAQFSPDGRHIVTTSSEFPDDARPRGDATARIWDAESGELLHTLLHNNLIDSGGVGVIRANYSVDGSRIITSASDNAARIWDSERGSIKATLLGHRSIVWDALFSPDGKLIATASFDNTAKIWSADTGFELRTLRGHGAEVLRVAFSPDGTRIATVSADRTARVWDTETGEPVFVFRGHQNTVVAVQFSPNGNRLLTASTTGVADDGTSAGTARIWDLNTGQRIQTLRGHSAGVFRAAFSPDGTSVVTASDDGTARVWEPVDEE